MMWDPFEEIKRLHEEMDHLFGRAFTSEHPLIGYPKGKAVQKADFRMPVSLLKETDKEVIAQFELPGADKKDIELNLAKDSIEVKAEKKIEKKDSESHEIRTSQFYRCVSLPAEIVADKAHAEYTNGILKVVMPKAKQIGSNTKRIEVK